MLKEVFEIADRIEADSVPDRAGPRWRNHAAPGPGSGRDGAGRDGTGAVGERRLLMAGGRTPRGEWTWLAPDAEVADRALPGPWSLTLLLRGRPA